MSEKRTKIESLLDSKKQVELCYQDTLRVIADAKQKLFDITKWATSLHALLLGALFSKQFEFSPFVWGIPIFIGIASVGLHYSIYTELDTHRRTLAIMRRRIGGLIYEFNKDHVDYYLDGTPPSHPNFYAYYRNSTFAILIVATLTSIAIVYAYRPPL